MLVAAAFCPHPPVLVPEVAQGATAELDELRAACRVAIARIAAPGRQLVLLGSGPTSRRHEPLAHGTFAGFGVPLEVGLGASEPGPAELPLSLTVGAWLVRDALGSDTGAIGFSIGPSGNGTGFDSSDYDRWMQAAKTDVALLVMGDGSARRSTAAPGYFDERAEDFDATVVHALGSGQGSLLPSGALHADVGAELLAAGVAAWDTAAHALGARDYQAEVLYSDAPYGVGYFVAAWT